jgi:hypothetical protein
MQTAAKTAVARHRERKKREGLVRIEVRVRKEDAPLLRSVAGALVDPSRAEKTRALLRRRIAVSTQKNLKELLAAAPLEGIELERDDDWGRDVDL